VSYLLEPKLKAELEKLGLGADVERVSATIRQNYQGEDVLAFDVVVKDELALAKPSRQTGDLFTGIAMTLRQRAAKAGVPLFASVNFLAHSEATRTTKKSA
jgi:hypothetical protein